MNRNSTLYDNLEIVMALIKDKLVEEGFSFERREEKVIEVSDDGTIKKTNLTVTLKCVLIDYPGEG